MRKPSMAIIVSLSLLMSAAASGAQAQSWPADKTAAPHAAQLSPNRVDGKASGGQVRPDRRHGSPVYWTFGPGGHMVPYSYDPIHPL